MGKLLKYCSSCEEGFAERFTFCPVCGASLQAFEMNPVTGEAVPQGETHDHPVDTAPIYAEAPVEHLAAPEHIEETVPATETFSLADEPAVPEFIRHDSVDHVEHIVEASAAGSYDAPATDAFSHPADTAASEVPAQPQVSWNASSLVADGPAPAFNFPKVSTPNQAETFSFVSDGPAPKFKFPKKGADGPAPAFRLPKVEDEDFGVTVINERNSRLKNGLLLTAAVLMVGFMISTVVVNIFGKDFDIASLSDDSVFTLIPEVDPLSIEPEKQPETDKKDDSGGGGGGGNKNPDPASKGTPPNMMKNPDIAPSTDMVRLQTPTLTQRVGVNGPERVQADTSQPYGVLNGADKLSDGPGSGTGIGTGRNGGVGSGTDSGLGTGSGGGAGNGHNGGIGDGEGPNSGAPPPIVKGVTTAYKIIAKPRAAYTDEARTNNVQGSVTLKIVLLASGQVGSITPLNRLPYGLTEQAIAAAKQIKFEPKKVNGVAQATTVTFQYGFNIY
ncbi:MAG: energy transducer TonB [Pyrinomonadaceae bacterium]